VRRRDGSFAAFRAAYSRHAVEDGLSSSMHTRHRLSRTVRYSREGLELEYSPVSEGVRYRTVNGAVPDSPMLALTGVETSLFPFVPKNQDPGN
jgi:hypothetical protein